MPIDCIGKGGVGDKQAHHRTRSGSPAQSQKNSQVRLRSHQTRVFLRGDPDTIPVTSDFLYPPRLPPRPSLPPFVWGGGVFTQTSKP
jgi:hypothetical protein